MDSPLFEIVIPVAKYKSKGKMQVISLNNISKWGRFGKTKIKNEYKDLLKEFFIPTNQKEPYKKLNITFHILRENRRKFDADNIVFNIKWFIDSLTETKWLIDDDKVTFTVVPAEYVENLTEMQLKVVVKAE